MFRSRLAGSVRKSRSTRGAGLSRVTHIVSPLDSHPDEGIGFGGFKASELIGRTRSRFSRRKPPNLPFIAIARKLLVALASQPDSPGAGELRLRAAPLAAGIDAWTGGWYGHQLSTPTP